MSKKCVCLCVRVLSRYTYLQYHACRCTYMCTRIFHRRSLCLCLSPSLSLSGALSWLVLADPARRDAYTGRNSEQWLRAKGFGVFVKI